MSTPTKFEKNVEAYDNCPLKVRLTEDEIHTFHEQGYLLLPKITTSEEVVWIRGIYDRLFEQRLGWDNGDLFDFAGTDDDGTAATLPQLLNPSQYVRTLRKTTFRANAHEIAKQLLGKSAELVFEHAMLKPAGTGGETPWHQDAAFNRKYTNYQSITFWMPLQPVDSSNGCLEFIPSSHKGPLLPHHSINYDRRIPGLEADGVDASQLIVCPLPAGGASIHHSRMLHHSSPNRSGGPRRAYALAFGVRSRKFTLRKDFPWNAEKATAREKRAIEAQNTVQHCVNYLKNMAKAVLR
jgi:ectoine hydroxylase-related dioxygenase (phytanoyl-CoA dioxygenase family)